MSRVRHKVAEVSHSFGKSVNDTTSRNRVCPDCKRTQRFKKKSCHCGHVFAIESRPTSQEGEDS